MSVMLRTLSFRLCREASLTEVNNLLRVLDCRQIVSLHTEPRPPGGAEVILTYDDVVPIKLLETYPKSGSRLPIINPPTYLSLLFSSPVDESSLDLEINGAPVSGEVVDQYIVKITTANSATGEYTLTGTLDSIYGSPIDDSLHFTYSLGYTYENVPDGMGAPGHDPEGRLVLVHITVDRNSSFRKNLELLHKRSGITPESILCTAIAEKNQFLSDMFILYWENKLPEILSLSPGHGAQWSNQPTVLAVGWDAELGAVPTATLNGTPLSGELDDDRRTCLYSMQPNQGSNYIQYSGVRGLDPTERVKPILSSFSWFSGGGGGQQQGPQGDTGIQGDTGATGGTGPQGPQGNVGPQGPEGEKGTTGAQGDAGPAGGTGPQGATGVNCCPSTTPTPEENDAPGAPGGDTPDPGAHKYGAPYENVNLGAPDAITEVRVSSTIGGIDVTNFFDAMDDSTNISNYGTLKLREMADATVWALYKATGVVDEGDYFTIGIDYISGPELPGYGIASTLSFYPAGDKGDAGNAGAVGDTGTQGDTGATGSTGDTGITGDAGVQGDTGVATTGDTGASGSQGDTGVSTTGDTGTTGPSGDTGVSTTGDTGVQGDAGSQGDTGVTGDTGADSTIAGDTGTQGDTGVTGNTGASGDTGVAGDTGADSTIAGDTGVQGDTGITGDAGSQGDTGTATTGDTGAQGDAGSQGDTGVATTGDTGVTGNTGDTGVSGDTGVTGSQGIQGDTGTGDTGPDGDTGVSGDTGTAGPSNYKSGSVTVNASGEATITFSTAFPNANYAISLTCGADVDTSIAMWHTKVAGSFGIVVEDDAGSAEASVVVDWIAIAYNDP